MKLWMIVWIVLIEVMVLCGCGGDWPPWERHKSTNPPAGDTVTADQVGKLRSIEVSTRPWAETCADGVTCLNGGDGDSTLYAGIACLSGEQGQCAAVRMSQSLDGQLWRAPDRVHVDASNSSSRDMLLGGLAYIVATKDTAFATKLVAYIHAHNDKLCTDATDNRCDVGLPTYSAVWGTMQKIWKYIGLQPDSAMMAGDLGDDHILAWESEFSPDGYQTHLPMVEMLIRQSIGYWDSTLANGALSASKDQPKNPFYAYVALGATSEVAALTIDECGGPEPTVRQFWSWQEPDADQRWLSRNGWDCISLINFLLEHQ